MLRLRAARGAPSLRLSIKHVSVLRAARRRLHSITKLLCLPVYFQIVASSRLIPTLHKKILTVQQNGGQRAKALTGLTERKSNNYNELKLVALNISLHVRKFM